MNIKHLAAATALAVAATTGMAAAQDWSLNPAYGTVNLTAGFTPDPYRVNVFSGGNNEASATIGGNCIGRVADAPDVRLNYNSGSFPLYLSVNSGGDTTLVVNGPDGRWYCNDDSMGLDPVVQFSNPMSGQYDIWVGSWGSGENATLNISELSP